MLNALRKRTLRNKPILAIMIFVVALLVFTLKFEVKSRQDPIQINELFPLEKVDFGFIRQATYVETAFPVLNSIESTNQTISLICIILTSPKSFGERGKAVWDTWANRCNKTLFTCNCKKQQRQTKNKQIEFLQLDVEESYQKMAAKVRIALKLIYEQYNSTMNWFLLVDDDTFIFMSNLHRFIREKNTALPLTYGYNFKSVIPDGYHSGGAGVLFTRESLKRIYERIVAKDCEDDVPYGDIAVGMCASKARVKMGYSLDSKGRERLISFS